MSQNKIVAVGGIKHFIVVDETGAELGRSVDFNPSDQGFAEDLYCLASKIQNIHVKKQAEYEAEENASVRFDISRAEDKEMREAVDAMFGEGFSKDVFKTRLFALANGFTVAENFLFALLDEMDESISANISARDARIKKYTNKYSKYAKKYHV